LATNGRAGNLIVASGFAERLKQLREAAGLSQYALAQKAKISKQAINQLEKGVSEPGWETVRKLARALGVSVAEFDVEDQPITENQPARKSNLKKPKK
jgi:transcriptional regulator with XRE-family HTH domain